MTRHTEHPYDIDKVCYNVLTMGKQILPKFIWGY